MQKKKHALKGFFLFATKGNSLEAYYAKGYDNITTRNRPMKIKKEKKLGVEHFKLSIMKLMVIFCASGFTKDV